MTFLAPQTGWVPTGIKKVLYLNWSLAILILAVACIGFVMLYSVADGDISTWAQPQMIRFGIGFVAMIIIGLINIHFWRGVAPFAYLLSFILLIAVEFVGVSGMGAQRWIDLGIIRLQPSEVMKISLVMVLALYYDWLDPQKVSHPLWLMTPIVLTVAPMLLVLKQPDLGTAILLVGSAVVVMFLAGVSLWYFLAGAIGIVTAIVVIVQTRGTSMQILEEYQYRRIETFLDPSQDPLGAGYHITQSKIALGSGGLNGRGFMDGTQTRLNFLPEKHTDFIFTTLAEEFGFVGSMALLVLYALIIVFCTISMLTNTNRFGALLTGGIAATFFFFFAVNMAMVMGLAPVVGVPLPLVSYGGSAMLVLMGAFGLVQSAHVHRPRQ